MSSRSTTTGAHPRGGRRCDANWQALGRGLPDQAYLTVLRDAMEPDECDPCPVYFGTESGPVFYSRDSGDHRQLQADLLPPMVSVSAGTLR